MKKVHCFPACAAAVLALSTVVQALEPALDPLPDLTAYPTQILVDGQAVEEGRCLAIYPHDPAAPAAIFLEQAGNTVEWWPGAQGAGFRRKTPGPIC